MTKLRCFAFLLVLLPALGLAAGPGPALEHAGTDLSDKASLQRGAGLFMNYCAGCHALSMHRYSRIASDLDLPPELVEQYLVPPQAAIGETIRTGIEPGGFGQRRARQQIQRFLQAETRDRQGKQAQEHVGQRLVGQP